MKTIGLPNAFTCWSPSVRILERFLREAGIRVVTTPRTTPAILKAATTFCSADFCMPVRVLVGHVHTLAMEHPELDAIIVPNVCQEHPQGSNCSKYRDVSGIVIRSLAGTVGYLAQHARPLAVARLEALLGREELEALRARASALPRILQPEIWSLEPEALFRVCYGIYCDIQGLGHRLARAAAFLPERLRALAVPHDAWCRAAFDRACTAVRRDRRVLDSVFRDPSRPHLAVVGRAYLHDDPLVSADLKPFFRRRRCDVITPHDVPFDLLREGFERTVGFYETHRMYQSFLDLVADRVDGVVVIGAFGCHPDAFENTYFLEYARALGLPAWLLKYDEQSSSTGFVTRYETILGFLERRRDARVAAAGSVAAAASSPPPQARTAGAPSAGPASFRTGTHLSPPADGRSRRPVLVWPHMSPIVDAMLEEILYQAGVDGAAVRPQTLSTDTVEAGNYKFTESCCPYALTTGSLIQSVRRVLDTAARDAHPRRIIMIQGQASGPCTYGWYAQMQQLELPKLFARELLSGGHTMEMLTVGGSNLVNFIGEMAAIGDARRLQPLVDLVRAAAAPGGLQTLSWLERRRLMLRAWLLVRPGSGVLTRTALAKLDALEAVRAHSLIVRAHERQPGEAAALWRQACESIQGLHTCREIRGAQRRSLRQLRTVDQDHETKPRVLVIGEIYVAAASFANRGTVETLLGREGIEVIEGTTVGGYLRTSLRVMRAQAAARRIRPLLNALTNGALPPEGPPDFDLHAKPFVLHHLGGDGRHSVSAARHAIEHLGIDGIVHLYPFKCMPEMVAKTALVEMARFYGVRYLPLDFDKETDIQRLRTEVTTFAQMLKIQVEQRDGAGDRLRRRSPRAEERRRRALGRALNAMSTGRLPSPAGEARSRSRRRRGEGNDRRLARPLVLEDGQVLDDPQIGQHAG